MRNRPAWYATLASWLWALIPILSAGMLGWVPVLHGWARLRRRSLLYWTLAMAGLTVLAYALMTLDPAYDDPGAESNFAGNLAVVLILGMVVAGSIQSFRLRGLLFGQAARRFRTSAATTSSMAVAQVEYARARRAEARALVDKDPAMARELRIGRPDVPGRSYDDGGLVDINHASPQAMVNLLELSPTHAEEIVRARAEANGFSGLGELGAYTSLPTPVVDALSERAVFLRY